MRRYLKKASGQVLPVTLGLALLACVSIFMVINSNRAIDEKINLVNAADAAAYSGAQMAARELNFMALTNRAMIANEVAIGHMMAYQTELDVLADALTNGVGGLIGSIIGGLLDLVGGDAIIDNFNQVNKIWSGAYILAVNASNALYQDYQEDDYRALAGIERDSLLGAVMNTVAEQYEVSPAVNISINSDEGIDWLNDDGSPDLREIAESANSNPFCSLIAFAQPGNAVGLTPYDNVNRFNALSGQCTAYYSSGNLPNSLGSLNNPVADGGIMLELLNRSAAGAPSADWVLQRNADYRIMGVRVERRGGSAAVWDSANQQLNWQTDGPDSIRTRGLLSLLLSFEGEANGDAKEIADEASTHIGGAVVDLLRLAGLCEEIDCDALADSSYTGIQRYAILNPEMADETPLVTAIAYQNVRCNDDWGRDEDGDLDPGFFTDMQMFGQKDTCGSDEPVIAYAQAKVFYQRPPCDEARDPNCTMGFKASGVSNEQANLFNPFWQARLAVSTD